MKLIKGLFSIFISLVVISGCYKKLICDYSGFNLSTNKDRNVLEYNLIGWRNIVSYKKYDFQDTLNCSYYLKCYPFVGKRLYISYLDSRYDISDFRIAFQDTSIISLDSSATRKGYGYLFCNIKKDGTTNIVATSKDTSFYHEIRIKNLKIDNVSFLEESIKKGMSRNEELILDSLQISWEEYLKRVESECNCFRKLKSKK